MNWLAAFGLVCFGGSEISCIDLFRSSTVSEDARSPPTHTVVIRNGHLFTFDLYDSERLLTPPEIRQRLEAIVQQSERCPGLGVGALTALPRDEWAEVKEN